MINTLLEKVKKDYSTISKRFDETRRNPWEEFEWFASYLKPNKTLLDVGCGNGRLAGFLKNRQIDYLGIDNNEELIALARKRHPFAKFIVADQTSLPFPNVSFDHVWNIAAFHHVPSKKLRLQTLREIHRILKKNGILVLTVWNLWQKKYRKYTVKSILRNLLFGEYEYNDTFIPWGKEQLVMRYYHAFRPRELKKLLEKAGFQIVDMFCTKRGKKVRFLKSYNICFVARKSC